MKPFCHSILFIVFVWLVFLEYVVKFEQQQKSGLILDSKVGCIKVKPQVKIDKKKLRKVLLSFFG